MVLPWSFLPFLVPLALVAVVRGHPSTDAQGERTSLFRYRLTIFLLIAVVMAGVSYVLFSGPLFTIHIASLFIGIAAVVWVLCFLMDRFWYHELLRGVISQCKILESSLSELGGLKVSDEIRKYSHASLNLSAGAKLSVFYIVVYLILVGTLAALLIAGPNKTTTAWVDWLKRTGPVEVYPLEGLPPFPQGSATVNDEIQAAICASRAALSAMRVNSALVIGRHDQVELRPDAKKAFSSNAGLARKRADSVATNLGDKNSCKSAPIASVVAFDSAPGNVGAGIGLNALAEDRRVQILGLRMIHPVLPEVDRSPVN